MWTLQAPRQKCNSTDKLNELHCYPILTTFYTTQYSGADKSLARPTSRCILFDGEIISFDASLVLYI